jgi:uncharacterized protein YbjT (DUF2867 family)
MVSEEKIIPHKSALIVGATGLTGGLLTDMLCADDYYTEIHVLTRRKLESTSSKVINHIVDFDTLPEVSLDFHVDDVYCCLGTTIKKAGSKEAFYRVDFEYVINTAKLGLKLGAKQFLVVSAIGADSKSSFFYNRVKGEMEEALKTLGYTAVHIFQPSLIGGNRKEFRFGEWLSACFMKITNPLWIGSLKNYKMISADKIAVSMVKAAKSNKQGICIHSSAEMQDV